MKIRNLIASTIAVPVLAISGQAANAADCLVGIAMYTLSAPYFAAQEVAAKRESEAQGCEVITSDGQNDILKQISDVEDMMARGIDILILNPRDPKGLIQIANAATAAGIVVVAIDNTLDPAANVVTLVQSSNQLNGRLVGEWLATSMKDEKIKMVLISGQQGSGAGLERRQGVLRGLSEAQLRMSAKVDFEILGHGWGQWAQEGGLNAMEDLLVAHPDINVVLGENDSMVLGARNALEAAGRLDEVLLVAAADGQKEALKLIKEGTYGVTGLNDPDLVATTAVGIAFQALRGELSEDFPKVTYTTPTAITKENVDEFYNPDAVF